MEMYSLEIMFTSHKPSINLTGLNYQKNNYLFDTNVAFQHIPRIEDW